MKLHRLILLFVLLCLIVACQKETDRPWQVHKNGADPLHDIEAITDEVAIAYSYGTGNIYRTTNGGNHWNRTTQLDSLYFEQIQFTDTQHGWLCGEQGKVYRSTDGGKSWQNRSPQIESDAGNLLLYGLYFENQDKGMVAGMAINFETRARKLLEFTTTNGGISWQSSEPPTMIMGIEKGPDDMIWAYGSQMILKKPKLEDHWQMVLRSTKEQPVADIRSLDFSQTPGRLIAAEFSNGNVWSSNDHGKTWSVQSLTTNRLRSILRIENTTWLAVGDENKEQGNYFLSQDDGMNWQQDSLGFPDIHRLAMSANYVWAVGKDGFNGRKARTP